MDSDRSRGAIRQNRQPLHDALGSQHAQAKRRERLLAAGIRPEQLTRLHGPIGLPLGGLTPEEIALAILAEIIAVRHAEKKVEAVGMRV